MTSGCDRIEGALQEEGGSFRMTMAHSFLLQRRLPRKQSAKVPGDIRARLSADERSQIDAAKQRCNGSRRPKWTQRNQRKKRERAQ
jgi:hypothetical protein